ncbi:hypothetical protein D3C81_1749770 [compost metagenome]
MIMVMASLRFAGREAICAATNDCRRASSLSELLDQLISFSRSSFSSGSLVELLAHVSNTSQLTPFSRNTLRNSREVSPLPSSSTGSASHWVRTTATGMSSSPVIKRRFSKSKSVMRWLATDRQYQIKWICSFNAWYLRSLISGMILSRKFPADALPSVTS